ncbi:hypothetical protein ACWGJ2_02800 [Streptomyces sp. NPDC054796]
MITSHAPPAKERTGEPTAATRHLCTGVYVDERFRDLVIDEVCTAPHRRVAPSYGFDIVPVMRHAWRAAALSAIPRATVAGAAAVPAFMGAAPTTVLVMCGLLLLWLLRLATLLRRIDSEPRLRRRAKRRDREPARKHLSLLKLVFTRKRSWQRSEKMQMLRHIGVVAVTLVLFGLIVAALYPADAAVALHLAGAITVMYLTVGAARQLVLNHVLRAADLRPARLSRRQQAADAQQHHVCAVYRRPRHSEDENEDEDDLTKFTLFGEESPFVGAGELVYQWNPPMSIQLLRPGDDETPLHEREYLVPPFQAYDLVQYLREAVEHLEADSGDVRLDAEVHHRVYVAETDVAADRSLLPRRLSEADMRVIINTPASKQHHFLEVTTPADGAEFVATVLLHVSLQGRTLSISTAACVLAHTPRSFQRTEEFGQSGVGAVLWAAFRELAALPAEIPRSWRIIRYFYALGKAALLPRDLTSTPIRNVLIGTRVSVRQRSAQEWSKIQLEKSDITGRMKTIEQRLLHAAGDFLHANGVDVSEFKDRALKIINSGIFNFGDNNTFSNNAVGAEAQVGGAGAQPTSPSNQTGGGSK